MTKVKKWLIERYMPNYAREALMEENKKLNVALKAQIDRTRELEAYIDGLETGIKAARKIIINNSNGSD